MPQTMMRIGSTMKPKISQATISASLTFPIASPILQTIQP